MKKTNRATITAAQQTKCKGTNKNGIISTETAKIIHLLFGTPTAKMPIKKEASDEKL